MRACEHLNFACAGGATNPSGVLPAMVVCNGSYACADGNIVVAAANDKLFAGLWAVCLLLLVGGEPLLVWAHHRDAEVGVAHHGFGFESWPGFYALFGFAAYVTLVLVAKQLRRWIMRPEDYYGD